MTRTEADGLVAALDAKRSPEERRLAREEARAQLDAGAAGEDKALAEATLALEAGHAG